MFSVSPSSPTTIPTPFSLSLISLMVSVDIKHHIYALQYAFVSVQLHIYICVTPSDHQSSAGEPYNNMKVFVRQNIFASKSLASAVNCHHTDM